MAIKTIRNKVIKAQIKIAQLVALLDQAKTAKDQEYKKEEEEEQEMDPPGVIKSRILNDDSSDENLGTSSSDTTAIFLVPTKK